MAHQRKNIRDAVITLLSTLANGNVIAGRTYPVDQMTLPAIGVHTAEEEWLPTESEMVTMVGGVVNNDRAIQLTIDCMDEGWTYLDKLDALALGVEQALGVDLSLGGECGAILYEGTSVERSEQLELPTGRLTLTYRVEYRTDARDPQTNIG